MPPWIWPFDLDRVDRAADVVGGDDLQDLRGAELEVDLDPRDLGGEAIGRVGAALPVPAERRARRIEMALGEQHDAVAVRLEPGELEALRVAGLVHQDRAIGERQRRIGAGVDPSQDQRRAARARRAPWPCPRRRSGARPRSCRHRRCGRYRRSPDRSGRPGRRAHRPRSGRGSCWSPGRCRPRRCRGSAGRPGSGRAGWSRGGASRYCRCRTTCSQCQCLAGRFSSCRLNSPTTSSRRRQRGASASRQAARPTLAASRWPVAVRSPARSALLRRKSRRSMPSALREVVHQRLVRDRRLRDAETAKRARRRAVGEQRAAARLDVRHPVGSDRMNRDAPGDRRPPGGVGAGVEVGGRGEGLQAALGIAAQPGRDPRRVALGGGGHALGALVDQRDRPLDQACGERRAAAAPTGRACRRSRRRRRSARSAPARARCRARPRSRRDRDRATGW